MRASFAFSDIFFIIALTYKFHKFIQSTFYDKRTLTLVNLTLIFYIIINKLYAINHMFNVINYILNALSFYAFYASREDVPQRPNSPVAPTLPGYWWRNQVTFARLNVIVLRKFLHIPLLCFSLY